MRNCGALVRAVAIFAIFCGRSIGAPPTSITLDGSLGPAGIVGATSPHLFEITPGMGRTVGSNLFQSLGTFNVGTGDTASFLANAGTQNIIARVTGGSASSIDGTLQSAANLFLLNPSGVMFGANAQINVSGAFVVGTPDYVKFADGGIFRTSLGGNDNLTSAPVSAFGFLSAHPAAVQATGAILTAHPFQDVHIIAGDVTLDGAEIDAPSGNLTIFSAASAGEVPFSLSSPGSGYDNATNTAFGNVTLKHGAYVDIDGIGGGKVVIRGGHLVVDNATISGFNAGSAVGGNISLHADQVSIQNGGLVETNASSTGAGGDIFVNAVTLTLDGTNAPQGFSTAIFTIGSTASAGSVHVQATGAVTFRNGGQILTQTTSPGGNITIGADSIAIDNSGASVQLTGIISDAFGSDPGSAGAINVTVAHDLSITGGGTIGSFGFVATDAPSITVHAGLIEINAMGSSDFTGIESGVSSSSNSGALTVIVDGTLAISNGGEISTATRGSGNGAAISVQASALDITGSTTSLLSTGISAFGYNIGNTGAITITTSGAIIMADGGTVAAETFGAGNAGNILVHSGSVTATDDSIIGSFSLASGNVLNTGNAGAVSVVVDQALVLDSGSLINSGTSSAGRAGTIFVQADSLLIDGMGVTGLVTGISDQTTTGATGDAGQVTVNVAGALTLLGGGTISSNTFSAGHGGDVLVHAGSLHIDGAGTPNLTAISSNTNAGATGDGGSLTVDIGGDATVANTGVISITAFSTGTAGQMNVNVGGLLTLTNGGEVSGGTVAAGASGSVFVHAGSLYVNGTGTATSATGISNQSNSGASGSSGPLTVNVDGLIELTAGGEISTGTRSTGNGGNLIVNAGSLTMDNVVGINHLTGITAETDGTTDTHGNLTGQGGNAGSVTVNVNGALTMLGGRIDTDTFCFGTAGDVIVRAGSIVLDGSSVPGSSSGIFSDSNGFVGNAMDLGGNAGSVHVTAGSSLSIAGGAAIGAATFTQGQGGDVVIQAGSVAISGASTGVSAQAFGIGDGGSIVINADTVRLGSRGTVTASSSRSNAGTIVINATTSLKLVDGGSISTEAAMDGGDITLNVGGVVYLFNSQIITAAGNNGGNILIDPQFVVLDHSIISANAGGQGGNITIITNDFLNNNALITATGATDGTITISAPDLDLSGSLVALPADLVSEERRLRESCARSVKHEFSTFIVVGRNGTESSPEELQPDFGMDAVPVASTLGDKPSP